MPVSSASPHSGHRSRLRQRLAREPLAVADYEILELLLGYGQPRKDTKPLARELLLRFHNIRGVLDAPPEQLLAVPGFGPGLLSMWQVLREVLARHAAAPLLQGVEVATPQAVAEMARARLAGSQQEECWLAMVNAGNRLVAWERLRQGNVESVPLLPRDVLEPALRYKASGIILVHNHPGGQTRPSQPDLIFTNTVRELAVNMGLRFLDHVIVTDNGCYSICQCRHLYAVREYICLIRKRTTIRWRTCCPSCRMP